MYQPSLDGASADGWYDGLDDLDVHLSSGPVNRFFYFLASGASADAQSPSHSVFLPAGMPGLGNDRAARIWYKTLTELLASDADFDAARAASITAAQELFGAGSAEETAVMSAWAAVNVGEPRDAPPRVRIRMPVMNPRGSFLDKNAYPRGILSKVQFYPTRADVMLQAVVENTDDQAAEFSLAAPGQGEIAGHIGADGSWTTPAFAFYSALLPITATAHADPTQFARANALLVELDADTDGESDAIDLGLVAMTWGAQAPSTAVQIAGLGDVSDWDLVFFNEAMRNAWPVR
jgi:hypothetical protein